MHKSVKRWAEWIQNTTRIDRGVLRDVTVDQLFKLEDADYLDVTVGLCQPKQPPYRVLHWLNIAFSDVSAGPYLFSTTARYNKYETCAA